ncbi:oligosaccharide flippase family protein [Paucibacter sp. AS339]|uniref:oligosaccharide flippase family protein n=1 Tax=Paucibacter hankyongi TaxID=3133434 RepID=UPI0030B6A079
MAKGSLLSSFLWQLCGNWGTRIGSLLIFALLARLLDPSALGTVNYVLGLLGIFLILADFALAEYLIYQQDAGAEFSSAIWCLQVGASLVLTLALCLAFWLAPGISVPNDVQAAVMWISALSMPLMAAARVPEALLRRESSGFRQLAVYGFFSMSAGALVALPMAWFGAGIWSLIAKQWVEVIVTLICLFVGSGWRPSWTWGMTEVRKVLAGSWGLMGSRLLDIASQRADVLLVGNLLGMHSLGVYSVAQKLFLVLQGSMSGAINGVLNPKFGRLRGQGEAFRDFFVRAVMVAALLTSLVYLYAYLLSDELIVVVFGSKWTQSIGIMKVMMLGGLFAAATQIILAPFISFVMQDNKWVLGLCLLDFLLTVTSILLAAPYGLLAVVSAQVLKTIFMGLVWWLRARHHLGFSLRAYGNALLPNLVLLFIVASSFFLLGDWQLQGDKAWTIAVALLKAAAAGLLGLGVCYSLFKQRLPALLATLKH